MSIIETEQRNGILVIHLKVPRMDSMQASKFKQELTPYVNSNRDRVILSLAETEYLDSSSLGIFRKFAVELHDRGGQLVLCNINPSVANLLKISRLEQLFQIATDIEAAMAME